MRNFKAGLLGLIGVLACSGTAAGRFEAGNLVVVQSDRDRGRAGRHVTVPAAVVLAVRLKGRRRIKFDGTDILVDGGPIG